MDFLKEGLSAFGGHHKDRNAPPEVYRPWIVEWDNREERWLFINEQTGERTFQYPGQGGGGYNQGGYGGNQGYGGGGGYGGNQGGYGGGGGYYEERKEEKKGGHGMLYGGLGAAAGLAAGAGLMYEGEKIHNDYDRDKYDLEDDKYRAEGYVDGKFDNGVQDVEDAPEDAARWAGREQQRVEDIPQDIDNDWDRAKYGVEDRFDNDVDRVEDAPERVAGWVGRKDGDVERFDDNVDNAYDEGRYEGRNDDNW